MKDIKKDPNQGFNKPQQGGQSKPGMGSQNVNKPGMGTGQNVNKPTEKKEGSLGSKLGDTLSSGINKGKDLGKQVLKEGKEKLENWGKEKMGGEGSYKKPEFGQQTPKTGTSSELGKQKGPQQPGKQVTGEEEEHIE